jgi:hypothetical protein
MYNLCKREEGRTERIVLNYVLLYCISVYGSDFVSGSSFTNSLILSSLLGQNYIDVNKLQ